ncbi:MAG: hypothetical protein ACTJLK_02395 [Anaplasma sp.]
MHGSIGCRSMAHADATSTFALFSVSEGGPHSALNSALTKVVVTLEASVIMII